MGIAADISVRVARARSALAAVADGAVDVVGLRTNQYRELVAQLIYQGTQAAADEGSYFYASSAGLVVGAPTPGVGLATIAAPIAFAETSPFVLIKNNNAVPGSGPGVRIVIDYIRLNCTAAGTAGTSIRWVSTLDSVNASRYTSGGSLLLSSNQNIDDATASGAQVRAGALVAITRASQARPLAGNILLKNAALAVGDSWLLDFATGDGQNTVPAAVGAVAHPAVVLGPQQWFAGHLVIPAQSAASSFEIEVGYIER